MSIQKWFRILNKTQFIARKLQAQKRPRRIPSAEPSRSLQVDDRPHVDLGWTTGEVHSRYLAYRSEACPVLLGAPLNDEATDRHKTNCLVYLKVPRWGLLSTLYITFNENGAVIEIAWHLADLQVISIQTFRSIESELREQLGTPEKSVSGRVEEWLWRGEELENYFCGTIGGHNVKQAAAITAFTGYRDMALRGEYLDKTTIRWHI